MHKLIKENNQLRVRVRQAEEECDKKNKLIQELIPTDGSSGKINKSHKDAALVVSLKKKIKDLTKENEQIKEMNLIMQKNIKLTKQNEADEMNNAYEQECKRLREMLEDVISSKCKDMPPNYAEMETKRIELKHTVKELKAKIQELNSKMDQGVEPDRRISEMNKKIEFLQQENIKQREKLGQYKITLDEANEKIGDLEATIKELEDRPQEERKSLNKEECPEVDNETVENLKKDLIKAYEDKERYKKNLNEIEEKLLYKDKEIRDVIKTAKENEEAYILKSFEDKEKLSQRIVRLELELLARKKEDSDNDKKAIKSNDIRNIVKEADLLNTKMWFKLLLIRNKWNIDQLITVIFDDPYLDEVICIKELIRIFKKPPSLLNDIDAENFARYLIESQDQPALIYNKYNEKNLEDIKETINNGLEIKYTKNFWEKSDQLLELALKKIRSQYKYLRDGVGENNIMSLLKWQQIVNSICPELSTLEKDLIVNIIAGDNNLDQLDFTVFLLVIIEIGEINNTRKRK